MQRLFTFLFGAPCNVSSSPIKITSHVLVVGSETGKKKVLLPLVEREQKSTKLQDDTEIIIDDTGCQFHFKLNLYHAFFMRPSNPDHIFLLCPADEAESKSLTATMYPPTTTVINAFALNTDGLLSVLKKTAIDRLPDSEKQAVIKRNAQYEKLQAERNRKLSAERAELTRREVAASQAQEEMKTKPIWETTVQKRTSAPDARLTRHIKSLEDDVVDAAEPPPPAKSVDAAPDIAHPFALDADRVLRNRNQF